MSKPSTPKERAPRKAVPRKARAKKATGQAVASATDEKQVPRFARDDGVGQALAAKPLFRLSMPVRWRDLDAFNHVNNSTFLTYVEEARLQWMQSLPDWLTDDSAPLLAATNINFRRPIEYPETLVIELAAERVGNTSVTLAHRVLSERDASIAYADGTSVMVWIDRRNGRPAALPDGVRSACTA